MIITERPDRILLANWTKDGHFAITRINPDERQPNGIKSVMISFNMEELKKIVDAYNTRIELENQKQEQDKK